MTLNILIAGRKYLATPFYGELLASTARTLNEDLPIFRQLGRVAVYVTDDTGVAHIIATR